MYVHLIVAYNLVGTAEKRESMKEESRSSEVILFPIIFFQ
jgi:hypothetical protein